MVIIYIEQERDRNIPVLEFLYSIVVWIILSEMDWILLRNILLFHIVTLWNVKVNKNSKKFKEIKMFENDENSIDKGIYMSLMYLTYASRAGNLET